MAKVKSSKGIYLDFAATTPLDREVAFLVNEIEKKYFANPSSLHRAGLEARRILEEGRRQAAQTLNCNPSEIVFTSGGTESANLAIQGVFKAAKTRGIKNPHIIISSIEHHSVFESAQSIKKQGGEVSFAKTDSEGFVGIQQLNSLIKINTVLVSIIYANNETGAVQDIKSISKALSKINASRRNRGLANIYFHTDACQAPGFLELDVSKLMVDLMTLSGSKIYGPKNSGLLYIRTGTQIEPLVYGGGQENGLRSGTQSASSSNGFALALSNAEKARAKQIKSYTVLWNYIAKKLKQNFPKAKINGPYEIYRSKNVIRLPSIFSFSIPGFEGEMLVLYLDAKGLYISTGSACSTSKEDPSHVLIALGRSPREAKEALRLSIGKSTSKKEIDLFFIELKKIITTIS